MSTTCQLASSAELFCLERAIRIKPLDFFLAMTKDNRQATRRNRYPVLASFYNFIINTGFPALTNPCNSSVITKIFTRPQAIQWHIVDKETIDEIIFRTTNARNRLTLELMARGGMRVGLKLVLLVSLRDQGFI